MLLSTLILLGADFAPNNRQSPLITTSNLMQRTMQQFYGLGRDDAHDGILLPILLLRAGSKQADCCTWLGISCADGAVIRIVHILPAADSPIAVSMASIPQTTQFVHFGKGRSSVWEHLSVRHFPRSLRYLFLKRISVDLQNFTDFTLDLGLLPRNAEEMYIHVEFPLSLWRTVRIAKLPETLRILCLVTMHAVPKVYVNSSDVPKDLQKIALKSLAKPAKLTPTSGRKVDKRIIACAQDGRWPAKSAYFEQYVFFEDQKKKQIEDADLAPVRPGNFYEAVWGEE